MRGRLGLIVSLVLVVGITGGALLLAVRSRSVEPPTPPPAAAPGKQATPAKLPGIKVEGALLEERGPDQQLQWRVTAGGELQYDKDTAVVLGRQVKFQVLHKNDATVTVLAPRFTADYNTRRLTFEDGVKGTLAEAPARFEVARLVYEFDTGKLVGTGGAKFSKPAYSATAAKLVVDTKRRKVRLTDGVRLVVEK